MHSSTRISSLPVPDQWWKSSRTGIEITNPGAPLVDTQRLVDTPPRSRNEALASLMRRIGICEERGSGWDKVVFQTELYQLPAPLPEVTDDPPAWCSSRLALSPGWTRPTACVQFISMPVFVM